MIWQEKKWLLLTLVLLLILNTVFFVSYRVRYEERIDSLNHELGMARAELESESRRNRMALDRMASRENTIEDLQRVYDEQWAMQDERLAALLIELQQLARRSGLQPAARNYAVEQASPRDRAISGAESMTVSFSVKGSYSEVRNLINLIELSRHFLIIDAITISGSDQKGEALTLNLTIRTVFKADEDELPEAAVI